MSEVMMSAGLISTNGAKNGAIVSQKKRSGLTVHISDHSKEILKACVVLGVITSVEDFIQDLVEKEAKTLEDTCKKNFQRNGNNSGQKKQ